MGLNALFSYDPETGVRPCHPMNIYCTNSSYEQWGQKLSQAYDRGLFAMLRVLLAADNLMSFEIKEPLRQIHINIDESKLLSCGGKAIGELLLHVHIYRCTADVEAASEYFGGLTAIDDYWLRIREIVATHKPRKEIFVQANTVHERGVVVVEEYEQSAEGVLQSWADRCKLLDL